jgi:RNA polymerase sigma-54 factor
MTQDTDDTELSLEKLAHFSSDDYFEERGADGRDLGYFTSGTVTHPSYEYFLSSAPDLFDHLIWQLRLSKESEEIREVAELIIGNIDENGYLRVSDEDFRIVKWSGNSKRLLPWSRALIPGNRRRDIKECSVAVEIDEYAGTLAETLIINNWICSQKIALSKQYNVSKRISSRQSSNRKS